MSSQEVNVNKWQEICKRGFSGDKTANDFILYLESCSKKHEDSVTWTTSQLDFQAFFHDMNVTHQENVFSLGNTVWLQLIETKRQVRSAWHEERQMQLKHHLTTCLTTRRTVVSEQYQRLEGLTQYLGGTDLGTVPFLRGLTGFLRYQLVHKARLAEWHMNEYVLTQKDEDAMERDIHVLKSLLGFQLVDKNNDDTVITIDQEDILIWRMNDNLSDHDIHEILKILPKDQNTHGYQSSHIKRKQVGLIQWLYQLVLRCFSFLSF